MKRIAIILSVIAVAAAATLSGCGSSSATYKTATSANWNTRTSTKVENNYYETWKTHKEVASYSVEFTAGTNSAYSVNYNDGASYVTEFYMESAQSAIPSEAPDGYAELPESLDSVYVFKTTYSISGYYTLTSTGETEEFDDSIETVCKYRPAGDNLLPVYSEQKIKNTAPAGLSSSTVSGLCVTTDCIYVTYFNDDATKAYTVTTDNSLTSGENTEVKEVSLEADKDYSVFENVQLRAAMRAFPLNGSATYTFDVYSPQNGAFQLCSASTSSPAELNPEDSGQQQIIDALDNSSPDDYIFFDGGTTEDGETRLYRYSEATVSISADLAGQSYTYWYSTVENADVNATKSVLLRMITPLSFGLGTLTYTLESLKLEEIN